MHIDHMNIIIPLGDYGKEFKEEGYIKPKPLINILGKEMIFHVLDSIKLQENDKLYIIYKSDLDRWNFCSSIKNKYPNTILIPLSHHTIGVTETILYGLNMISDINKKTIAIDCDNFYSIDILSIYRDQINNLLFCFKDIQEKPLYSYIKLDNDNNIIDIGEKKKISNLANTGCYCFESGQLLKDYCDKNIKNNAEDNGFYLSYVVMDMIKNGYIFACNLIDYNDYHCVGSPLQTKIFCSINKSMAENKRFCIDLDNTLVTYPKIKGDYSSVDPINNNIKLVKYLKKLGHYIIIYTARRMRTHDGNVGKIVADIGIITLNTLKEFDIPYDEIVFGKPYAHFYIDDLAVHSYGNIEKEIGFYKTEIQEREFNKIDMGKIDTIIKRGPENIIKGEIHWYLNIPQNIKKFFPVLFRYNETEYELEKINGISMSYQYVNDSMTIDILDNYLKSIEDIHLSQEKPNENNVNIYLNYKKKIESRYNSYDYSSYENNKEIYNELMDYFEKYEKNNMAEFSVIHGDPVFSNCMADVHNNLKFFDMRGCQGDIMTIYGDKWYDYAKIYQSLIGYDEILLDKIVNKEYKNNLINHFHKYIINKFDNDSFNKIKMITNSLLFTLIPLHNNDKCIAYYELIKLPS